MKYIDIHSHSKRTTDDILTIISKDFSKGERVESKYESIGIHPWSSDIKNLDEVMQDFETYIKNQKLWILGEMGLDRVSGHDMEVQRKLFEAQLELAKSCEIQCIVIHCVKAYSDVLPILIQHKFSGKVLLHDYNSNLQSSQQFSNHFDTYFSFGKKLFNSDTQASKVFPQIDINKVFLETDDNNELQIEELYAHASDLLGCPQEDLIQKIINNLSNFSSALFTDNTE